MLPKQSRLSGYQIPKIIKYGKRCHGEIASLILIPKKDASSPSQFTVVIPQRLHKRSVKRNRTKRLLNEAIFKNLKNIKAGFEIVLMAKKILDKEKLQDVKPEMSLLLKKAGIL